MVKSLLKLVLVLVVLFVGIGMLLPRKIHVERTVVIDAPPATVFTLLNGYGQFNRWSPWYERDPAAKYTWEGPARGVGARLAWVGDPKTVGSGNQTIVESRPDEFIRTALDFGEQGKAEASFLLEPAGTSTRVVWGMDSDMGAGPIGRWVGLMMDDMVGKDYEKGLANLKGLAEKLPKVDTAGLVVEEMTVEPYPIAVTPMKSSAANDDIAAAIAEGYGRIGRFMAARQLQFGGAPMTITHAWSDAGFEFEAAIPVDRSPAEPVPADSEVQVRSSYGGRVVRVIHKGSYDELKGTFDKAFAWVAINGLETNGHPWEQYMTDPGNTPEAENITHIYIPVK